LKKAFAEARKKLLGQKLEESVLEQNLKRPEKRIACFKY
jgi:hypothetical protein